jgi:coenzyme F420-reducing hydrogenase gamma subunit
MKKPTVAIFDFACCEGCQLQLVNLEEELIDLISVVTPVEWREAASDHSETYDIAIVEGSITRDEDAERLKTIRKRASVLVAIGACATSGGVNKLKNHFDLNEVRECVYGDSGTSPHLSTAMTKSVGEVVEVDYNVPGCPINVQEFCHIVRCLAKGVPAKLPNFPVCVECKMRDTICRYEYNELCLGPITRAGCNAPCPAGGLWCFGCRGLVDNPNVDAAREVMDYYGLTVADLQEKMLLFNNQQPGETSQ